MRATKDLFYLYNTTPKWKTYGDSYNNFNMKPDEVDGNKWEKYFTKLYDKGHQSTLPTPTGRPNIPRRQDEP